MGIRPGSATLNTRLMVRLGAAVRVPGECGPPVQPPPTSRAYDRPGHSHTWLQGKFCGHRFVQPCSVVEAFHFGPAPASQDGGSGSTTLVIYAFNTAPLLMIFFIFLMVVSNNHRSDMPNNYRITLFEYTNIDSVYF